MNKAAVKRRLTLMAGTLDPIVLVDDTDAVQVTARYGPPGDDVGDTCIYFDGPDAATGNAEPTAIATSKPTEDVFVVSGFADAFGFSSCEEAEEAAERIFNAFDARLSAWSRLVDPDNPEAPGTRPDWFVSSAYVTTTALRNGNAEGNTWGGRYEFSVQCKTDLRYGAN